MFRASRYSTASASLSRHSANPARCSIPGRIETGAVSVRHRAAKCWRPDGQNVPEVHRSAQRERRRTLASSQQKSAVGAGHLGRCDHRESAVCNTGGPTAQVCAMDHVLHEDPVAMANVSSERQVRRVRQVPFPAIDNVDRNRPNSVKGRRLVKAAVQISGPPPAEIWMQELELSAGTLSTMILGVVDRGNTTQSLHAASMQRSTSAAATFRSHVPANLT